MSACAPPSCELGFELGYLAQAFPRLNGTVGLCEDGVDDPVDGVRCSYALFLCLGAGIAQGRKMMRLEFGFRAQPIQNGALLGRELHHFVRGGGKALSVFPVQRAREGEDAEGEGASEE